MVCSRMNAGFKFKPDFVIGGLRKISGSPQLKQLVMWNEGKDLPFRPINPTKAQPIINHVLIVIFKYVVDGSEIQKKWQPPGMYGQPVGKINGTTYQHLPTNHLRQADVDGSRLRAGVRKLRKREVREGGCIVPRENRKKKMVPKQKQSSRFLSARKVCPKKSGGKQQQKSMAKFVWMIFVCFRTWSTECVILNNCHCSCESLHWILWMVDCHGWMFFDGCVSALKRENRIWWFVPWRPWINLPFEYPFVPSRCQVVTFCRHSFYWKWLKNARNASWRQHEYWFLLDRTILNFNERAIYGISKACSSYAIVHQFLYIYNHNQSYVIQRQHV